MTDEVVTEIYRLYEYFYDNYQEAFDRIEAAVRGIYWSYSLADFDSFDELKCDIIDALWGDWFSYNIGSEINAECICL